ncbi:MAG: UDP-forming cellulose synthase catalytic subunit [Cyanobacteria bacterium J06632_22]
MLKLRLLAAGQAGQHRLLRGLSSLLTTPWGAWLLTGVLILISLPLITTPLTILQQGITAVIIILVGWLTVRLEQSINRPALSQTLHLLLVWFSLLATLRYLYYRTSYTLNLDGWANGVFSLLLYGAELYAIATLLLTYFQKVRLRTRQPVDLSQIPNDRWPTVDIYIPTYNEDVAIVRKTALAALAVAYPSAKKHVYVLDDGRAEKYRDRRRQLRQMCQTLGCELLTRDNNDHAKAGNINTALQRTEGELVLILDCDHIPVRSFLEETVGFFQDPQVALVQTPHWFYNPDPFERNLVTRGRVPVGNELFYKVVQRGNDYWNAGFFCGSAAVIRRQHLMAVGGIATETVTEDCHTSLRLHAAGYRSVYYDKILIAGLAPETFASYVGQQVRWARGMAQILRLEKPLFNRRLSLPQRICYFSATSHFFFGFPRLIYAIAPVLFLLLHLNPIRGIGIETVAYALPHIVLAMQANFISYKKVRFSFWNELLEYALSIQAGVVTLLALVNPKLGQFNVTDKGTTISHRRFDVASVRHLLGLIGVSLVALSTLPAWLLLRPGETEAIIINGVWCGFNLILLSGAALVAFEQPQQRRAHRLRHQLLAVLCDGHQACQGTTVDISELGAKVQLAEHPTLLDDVTLEVLGDYGQRAVVQGKILRTEPSPQSDGFIAVVAFVDLTQTQTDALTLVLYSDVHTWYDQTRTASDRPLKSLWFIATSPQRALQARRAATRERLRQSYPQVGYLFWQGHYYRGRVSNLGMDGLQLVLGRTALPGWANRSALPIGGFALERDPGTDAPPRWVVCIRAVMPDAVSGTLTVELTFPPQLQPLQGQRLAQSVNFIAQGSRSYSRPSR